MASLPYQDVQLKRSGMNVPRCVCSASALSCSALLTRPRVWCRAITNFIAGRPPHKSNFYCHPGRAGGTPMLIVVVDHRGGFHDPRIGSAGVPAAAPLRAHDPRLLLGLADIQNALALGEP